MTTLVGLPECVGYFGVGRPKYSQLGSLPQVGPAQSKEWIAVSMNSNSYALTEADRDRLAKLLGLLGSDHLGERDNAARAAHRLVQQHGITWFDIIIPGVPPPDADQDDDPVCGDWRRTAAACCRYRHLLNRWEAEFLGGLQRFPHLSFKQRTALTKIVVRLRTSGCEL